MNLSLFTSQKNLTRIALFFGGVSILWVLLWHAIFASMITNQRLIVKLLYLDGLLYVLLTSFFVYWLFGQFPSIPPWRHYSLTPKRIAVAYAVFSYFWIEVFYIVLSNFIDDPLIQGSAITSTALLFVCSITFFLFILLKNIETVPQEENSQSRLRFDKAFKFTSLFIVLLITVPAVNYSVMNVLGSGMEKEALGNLSDWAELKTDHLQGWLAERQHTSAMALNKSKFTQDIKRLQGASPNAYDAVYNKLEKLRQERQYKSIVLFDQKGRTIMVLGAPFSKTEQMQTKLKQVILDANREKRDDNIHIRDHSQLDMLVPLFLPESNIFLGMVLLRVDSDKYLINYLQNWAAIDSGKATMVAQYSKGIFTLFHAERSEQKKIVIKRLPETNSDILTAIKQTDNLSGAIHSTDHKGNHVLAAWCSVKGTNWYLIAQVDDKKLLSPLRNLAFWISSITILILLVIGIILILFWHIQQRTQQLAMKLQEEQLLNNFYTLPFIGMGIMTPAMDRWLQVNDKLCEILGYAREELIHKSWNQLTLDKDCRVEIEGVKTLQRKEKDEHHQEKALVRKNGDVALVEVRLRCVRKTDDTVDYLVITLEDITAKKEAEAQIKRLNQLYAALSHCNQAIVYSQNKESLFKTICEGVVKYGEMESAWIGLIDKETGQIAPMAVHSTIPDYAKTILNIYTTINPDEDYGQGPSAYAIRYGEPVWIQDSSTDVRLVTWRDILASLNVKAAATLPLFQGGNIIGVMNVYSHEVNPFDIRSQKLLIAMSHDIGFALDHFDREAQLKLSGQIFEQSNEGIMLLDDQANIELINQAFTTITGYTREEAIGQNPRMLSSGQHDAIFYAAMWNTILEKDCWLGEICNRRKSGEIYSQWLSTRAMRDSEGVLTHYIGVFSDLTERKKTEERIHWLAHFDDLTGLPNRTLLADRANQALNIAQRKNNPLTLMFLDIDNFKNVNDSLGHSLGDKLLKQYALRLQNLVREQDTVSRLGGDEFVLVLPGTDTDGAAYLAERLLQVTSVPYTIENHEISASTSIGIAVYPTDGADFDALSRSADTAMYRAKRNGRDNYCFFTQEMQEQTARTLFLDNALRRALERNQFTLHYQPQLALNDGKIIGFEALIRWSHPELGSISPVEFIPIAESNGTIIPIGEWVLRTAIAQFKDWIDKGFNVATFSVNLSAVQFRHPNLSMQIIEILSASGVSPESLILELTESIAMHNPIAAIAVINELRSHNIRLSIDDFGTGYSSLAYLKRFNVHSLKIDRSFIYDLPSNTEDIAIVEAIISMAKNLGIQTIAEGVETKEQLEFLQERNCNEIQGYYLSRPMSADQVEAFLMMHTINTFFNKQ